MICAVILNTINLYFIKTLFWLLNFELQNRIGRWAPRKFFTNQNVSRFQFDIGICLKWNSKWDFIIRVLVRTQMFHQFVKSLFLRFINFLVKVHCILSTLTIPCQCPYWDICEKYPSDKDDHQHWDSCYHYELSN